MTVYDAFIDELEKLGAIKLPKFFSQFGKGNIARMQSQLAKQKTGIRNRAMNTYKLRKKIIRSELDLKGSMFIKKHQKGMSPRQKKSNREDILRRGKDINRRKSQLDMHLRAIVSTNKKIKGAEDKIKRIRGVRLGAGITAGGAGLAGATAGLMGASKALQQA